MVVKGMEDEVIPLLEEYKPVTNTSDCEKGMKDGFVEMKESDAVHTTSIVAKSRRNAGIITKSRRKAGIAAWRRNKTSIVAVVSTILCLLLAIFPMLKISSDGRNFMAKYENIIMVILVPLVFFIQLRQLYISSIPPVDNRIFGILFILLLSTAISVIEVGFFSWTAASIILIASAIVFAPLVRDNWEFISTEDIVFSKGIQKFISVICFLSIVYTIKSIAYYVYV
ncbi:transmembrane protein, putative [Medicago truncatula]|uniref:Transmembrane protein, putative n=1 Tax=Medicago truncatula TaxID=3880 RepID=A0A072TM59_MEDTR|nr:transmembrane protein, putative [Medicago truncatula]